MASGAFTPFRRRLLAALAALAALFCACALGAPTAPPRFDPRAAIRGQVVDAATGAPVAGAAVIAGWQVELPPSAAALALGLAIGGHGNVERRTAYVREAVTDADGRFEIPAWSAAEQWVPGELPSYGALLWFFAPGYSRANTRLNVWAAGRRDELEPGLRGAGVVALYRPGAKPPWGEPGLVNPSVREPTPAEARFRDLQGLRHALDDQVRYADARDAAQDSAARERVRGAQRHIRELLEPEVARAYQATREQSR